MATHEAVSRAHRGRLRLESSLLPLVHRCRQPMRCGAPLPLLLSASRPWTRATQRSAGPLTTAGDGMPRADCRHAASSLPEARSPFARQSSRGPQHPVAGLAQAKRALCGLYVRDARFAVSRCLRYHPNVQRLSASTLEARVNMRACTSGHA